MELVLNIFKQLGADSTFFTQFVIFVIAFILLKVVLFEKMKKVIEERESNTTGLAEKAKEKEEEANILAEKYQGEIDQAQAAAQNKFQEEKVRILEGERAVIKKAEDESFATVEKEKKEYASDLQVMSKELMGSSSDIADQLVDRLTK